MNRKRRGLSQWIHFGSICGMTLILAATWTGCGNDSGPTQPANLLRVTTLGSLTVSSGSVSAFEAASTFDGAQLAFNHCDLPCRTLELRRPIGCTRGSHTLGIQPLSQSCNPSPCSLSDRRQPLTIRLTHSVSLLRDLIRGKETL